MTSGNKGKKALGSVLLLLTALIWGIAFVAQSVGMESVGPFTFSAVRILLGAAVLIPVAIIGGKRDRALLPPDQLRSLRRKTWIHGIILGVVFCAAVNFQQFAFYDSTPGKIAFITAMYIFFVPIISLLIGRRSPFMVWICAAVAAVGLYLLCIGGNDMGGFNRGDALALICSIIFAVHILLIDRYAPGANGAMLSCVQFLTAGIISGILMFIFEKPDISAIADAAVPILYAGILSCGAAYTLQIIGQKYTEPTVASLLMCMESVFAVIASAVILGQYMKPVETAGCVIMFAAIILSQIFVNRKKQD